MRGVVKLPFGENYSSTSFFTLRARVDLKVSKFKNFFLVFLMANHRFHLSDNQGELLSLVIFILNWIYHKFLISKNIKLFRCMLLLFHCHKLTTFCLLFVCYLCRCIRLSPSSISAFSNTKYPFSRIFCWFENIMEFFFLFFPACCCLFWIFIT